MISTATKWHRASKHQHCPVCDRPDWCLIADDGTAAICPRTPSNKWVGKNGGGGYLHQLTDSFVRPALLRPAARPQAKSSAEISNLMAQYRTAVSPERLDRLAVSLGVTVESLNRLGIGWAFDKSAWAFPMRNARLDLMGVRLRCADGKKFSVTGGHEGLFIPAGINSCPSTLLFCEGPTSLAALLDMGFDAIGRPSCSGGIFQVCELLAQRAYCDVVIVGDRDEAKSRPDGSTFRPGQDGAERFAHAILPACRSVKVILPPFVKDARDWKSAGATRGIVEAVIRAANYFRKDSDHGR